MSTDVMLGGCCSVAGVVLKEGGCLLMSSCDRLQHQVLLTECCLGKLQ